MKSLTWYARRLRAMSPREVAWRVGRLGRDLADWALFPLRRRPKRLEGILRRGRDDGTGFRATDMAVGEWARTTPDQPEHEWCRRLRAKADKAADHRLSFFDLRDRHLGDPIDWNRDHHADKAAPMRYARRIDYRIFDVAGDCKLVWEPNRHQHLVVLARAYRASGDRRYAAAVAEQLESWLRQCPYGIGMNWRSPMELGIRLINWVWALDLIDPSGVVDGDLRRRILVSVHRHLWEIVRQYSGYSSANNHLIGEAAGVYVATSYFLGLGKAGRWNAQSRRILGREIIRQTHPDGSGREQALGYHFFVLQFFVLAGVVARRVGRDFPPEYWSRLERMLEFAAALAGGGDNLPAFGDGDDGYVLDLGGGHGDYRSLLAVGAVLFGRGDFKAAAGAFPEPARWLLGRAGRERFDAVPAPSTERHLRSRAFADGGYYLLQHGGPRPEERISVVFDCGELGFPATAGHGHADALSFTLRAFGRDVLVDPGTYDYYTYPRWRDYFRSTRAHNTVVVDARDQSVMLGPFLWGDRARPRCLSWQLGEAGGRAVGEHDGYRRLDDPVVHRRTLELDGPGRRLTVRDDIFAGGRHDLEVCFHLGEHCRVAAAEGNRFVVDAGAGTAAIELDGRLSVEALSGSEDPIGGWVSRGYHRKAKATTLIGRCVCDGNASLLCRIDLGAPAAG